MKSGPIHKVPLSDMIASSPTPVLSRKFRDLLRRHGVHSLRPARDPDALHEGWQRNGKRNHIAAFAGGRGELTVFRRVGRWWFCCRWDAHTEYGEHHYDMAEEAKQAAEAYLIEELIQGRCDDY